MNMPIIGLGGYAFSGKDAVADVLEGQDWARGAFSDPVHEALLKLDPWCALIEGEQVRYSQVVDMFGYSGAKEIGEVRRLLQTIATEVVRDMFGQNSWSELMRARIKSSEAPGFAATGVRFPEEVAMLREEGAELWWVLRPGYGPINSHASERSIRYTDFDRVILNDGTLEDLREQVLDAAGIKR